MEVSTLEERRRAAVRKFWLYLLGGIALAAAIAWALIAADWVGAGVLLAIAVFVVGLVLAIAALSKVGDALKLPVLETLAHQGGLTFLAAGFDPPVYPDARPCSAIGVEQDLLRPLPRQRRGGPPLRDLRRHADPPPVQAHPRRR